MPIFDPDKYEDQKERARRVVASAGFDIVDADWTPRINIYRMTHSCGAEFGHRADQWWVKCPRCGTWGHLQIIRELSWAKRKNSENLE